MKSIFLSFFILLQISFVYSTQMFYTRSEACIHVGLDSCKQWNITVNLSYYQLTNFYMCFPSETKVMTENGPKLISQLEVGDQILAYNFEKGHNVFSPVTAWLHRDTQSKAEFTNIITKNGKTYRASSGHNIGFNKNGTIGFKYAEDLAPGDELVANSGQIIVKSSNELTSDIGLFSPVTSQNNFYIFPLQSQQFSSEELETDLILVHCFAQIDEPLKKENWINLVLYLYDFFGFNKHQNKQVENYMHPITSLMSFFGENKRKMKIHLAEGDQNHLFTLAKAYKEQNVQTIKTQKNKSSSEGYSKNKNTDTKKINMVRVFACLMQINSIVTQS